MFAQGIEIQELGQRGSGNKKRPASNCFMGSEGDEISGEVEAARHRLHLSDSTVVVIFLQENLELQAPLQVIKPKRTINLSSPFLTVELNDKNFFGQDDGLYLQEGTSYVGFQLQKQNRRMFRYLEIGSLKLM